MAFLVRALAHGEQHIHAQLGHLGFVEDLDFEAMLGQAFDFLGVGFRVQHVRRQVGDVACQIDTGGHSAPALPGRASGGGIVSRDHNRLERRALIGRQLGAVIVEAVGRQTRAKAGAGGAFRIGDTVQTQGDGGLTAEEDLAGHGRSGLLDHTGIGLVLGTETEEHDARRVQPCGGENFKRLARLAFKARGFDRAAQGATRGFVCSCSGSGEFGIGENRECK